ncbi:MULTISPECIES: lipopolysaccharide assembly protein LapB [Mycobacteriales]|uniref:tetratricopeptide repeat protein n=1 Tax=Mycobacteriales TaxID=85007 RepID=UPI0016AFC743|nr:MULTISPECIES: hypothetical protein [Mycobacteriales]NLG46722.1 hypothetical protein [Gordonia sp. (in: high G+C Gram-positive bacteria)]
MTQWGAGDDQRLATSLGVRADALPAVTAFITLVSSRAGDADATRRSVDTWNLFGPDLFADLADPAVATGVANAVFEIFGTEPESIAEAARWLLEHGPAQITAAMRWIIGLAAEAVGRIDDAEGHFERSCTADGEFVPALLRLAQYASDRGDALRGLALYDRIPGGREHPMFDVLLRYRDDREYSLVERARWLYEKAGQYLEQSQHHRDHLVELASIRIAPRLAGDSDLQDGLDDFVWDVVLFDCGAFAEFIAVRGPLLPADEQLLAQQWLLIERSLFEVEDVRPGAGMTMRAVRTGDRIDVTERAATRQVRAGEFYCARVVPVGEGVWNIFGGAEPVSLPQREPLLDLLDDDEATPEQLVAFLSARFGPPQFVTASGEPMVFCSSAWTVAPSSTLRRKLSRRFGAAHDDEWTWTEGDRVLGVVVLDTSRDPWTIKVDAMSEFDYEDMVHLVLGAAPGATLVREGRVPAAQMIAERRAGAMSGPAPQPDLDDPEIAALLDEKIRAYEQQWLDEQIPALDGLTPRQAAADPTRRDDLLNLLGSMPDDERPGTMSARRLREALGL